MEINCSVNYCKYNERNRCTKEDVFISDAETGEPVCQDYEDIDD